jgi:ABC-2 type transport system permease protein
MFFSIGFVPLELYPDWIQPFVEHRPVRLAVEVMRSVSLGGPVSAPLCA